MQCLSCYGYLHVRSFNDAMFAISLYHRVEVTGSVAIFCRLPMAVPRCGGSLLTPVLGHFISEAGPMVCRLCIYKISLVLAI